MGRHGSNNSLNVTKLNYTQFCAKQYGLIVNIVTWASDFTQHSIYFMAKTCGQMYLLQLLQNVTRNLSGTLGENVGAGSPALLAPIDLPQKKKTDHVDFAWWDHRGSADLEPQMGWQQKTAQP